MTEKEEYNDSEMKVNILLSGYLRELGEGKDFMETTDKTAKTIVKTLTMTDEQKQTAKKIKRLERGTIIFALFYVPIILILAYYFTNE